MIETRPRVPAVTGPFDETLATNPLPAAITDSYGLLIGRNQIFEQTFAARPGHRDTDLIALLRTHLSADSEIDLTGLLQVHSSSIVDLELRDDRHFQVLVVPQFTGKQHCWLWEFRDVTAERLLHQHASHEERMGAVVRLAGGMAHEFNNLLTAVLGNLELMQASPERSVADVTGNVEAAESAALRACQLIDELRRFAGRPMSVPRLQPVVPIVQDAGRILAKMAPPAVRVVTTIDPDLEGVRARISAEALSEALLKVGACAVHESARNGDVHRAEINMAIVDLEHESARNGDVHLRVHRLQAHDGSAAVQICMSGLPRTIIGDRSEFVFEPFQSSSAAPLSSLSLAVAYSLISGMGGRLQVTETDDLQAVVQIQLAYVDRLPVAVGDDMAQYENAVSELRVAVVDSEPGIRSVGQGMLKHLGHQATCFASGEDLLARLRDGQHFDLILLDHALRGLSGRTTYSRLRQLTEARVLICSGRHVDLHSFASAATSQPDGVLEKPFSLAVLASAIADML